MGIRVPRPRVLARLKAFRDKRELQRIKTRAHKSIRPPVHGRHTGHGQFPLLRGFP